MFTRVEVEFLSGSANIPDRRTFEKVQTLEFVQNSHLRIVSVDDGEMVVKWDRLQWYHSQPLSQFADTSSIDTKILMEMMDARGNYPHIIQGIKKCRDLTGRGLKEAKDYCEKLRDMKISEDQDIIPF